MFIANDSIHGYEPWISDGTTDGTKLWMDINPGSGSTGVSGQYYLNGKFFFVMAAGLIPKFKSSTSGKAGLSGFSILSPLNVVDRITIFLFVLSLYFFFWNFHRFK